MSPEKFKELVEGTHGGKAKWFDQAIYIKSYPGSDDVKGGVCRALASAYLVRNFVRSVEKDDDVAPGDAKSLGLNVSGFGDKRFFQAFRLGTPNSENKDFQRFEKIKTVQQASRAGKDSPTAVEEVASASKSVRMLSNHLMDFDREVAVDFGLKSALNAAELPDETGFWLITCPGHMIAACIRKNMFGNKAKCFDPNLGEAKFDTTERLRAFLTDFLIQAYGKTRYLFKRVRAGENPQSPH